MVDELPDCVPPACELSVEPLPELWAKQNPDKAAATNNAKTFFMLNSPRVLSKWRRGRLDASPIR